jgi:hypothetical protein
MINRLFKLALISVASPIMGAQTQAIAAPPAAAEAPQPLFVTVKPPVGRSGNLEIRYYINPRVSTSENLKAGYRKVEREAHKVASAAGAIVGTFVVTRRAHIRGDHPYISMYVEFSYKVPG